MVLVLVCRRGAVALCPPLQRNSNRFGRKQKNQSRNPRAKILRTLEDAGSSQGVVLGSKSRSGRSNRLDRSPVSLIHLPSPLLQKYLQSPPIHQRIQNQMQTIFSEPKCSGLGLPACRSDFCSSPSQRQVLDLTQGGSAKPSSEQQPQSQHPNLSKFPRQK
jgi:hypothetical protein